MKLMDCHVHVDEIRIWHPEALAQFGKRRGEVRWYGVSVEDHAKRIRLGRLDQIVAIYESPETVLALRDAAPGCDIRAMRFLRTLTPNMDELRGLRERDLLQGIKVHPVVDRFELTGERLSGVLAAAREFDIPLLYHADDRRESMHLTTPEMQRELIEDNPDIQFIVGHGGAYANPRLVGDSPPARSYWNGSGDPAQYSRRLLVNEALRLVRDYKNTFYDLSIVTNRYKANIVASFLNANPEVTQRILVGTDYPIKRSRADSQVGALVTAGLRADLVDIVIANRLT